MLAPTPRQAGPRTAGTENKEHLQMLSPTLRASCLLAPTPRQAGPRTAGTEKQRTLTRAMSERTYFYTSAQVRTRWVEAQINTPSNQLR